MTFKSLFGQITILSLSLVNFRVSRFHVSHLTHEIFKLRLQNTLNMSKTARVYFGVLHSSFTIPYTIGNVEFKKDLCDSEASINLMPLFVVKRLCLGELTPIAMTLQMVDRTMAQLIGGKCGV